MITKDDLQSIDFLYCNDTDLVDDMTFLKYCTNLTDVYITVQEGRSLKPLCNLPNLKNLSLTMKVDNIQFLNDIVEMESIEKLGLNVILNYYELSAEDQEILDQFPNLKRLSLDNVHLCPGCEEKLNQLEELSLGLDFLKTYDIDFNKLTGLKKLSLKNIKPYDAAIFLSTDEYHTLIDAGVEVEFSTEEDRTLYLEVSQKIDRIVEELNLSEDSTDQEKLDAVLIYVIEHLQYDEEIAENTRLGTDTQTDTRKFYEQGDLYGALEMDLRHVVHSHCK